MHNVGYIFMSCELLVIYYLEAEYSSYARPKPWPAPAYNPGGNPSGQYGARPEPGYGFHPNVKASP